MKVRQFRNRVAAKGSFHANLLTLMSGTALAQMITVAVSPLLTRMFTPEAFGVFGVYASLVFILASFVTLQYEQALMLPKDADDALVLFGAALLSVCLISGISLLCCLIFFNKILSLFKVKELSGWIFLIPAAIFLQGIYLTLNSWSTRQKKFGRAAVSQVVRSGSIAGMQLFSGIMKAGPEGLVGGAVAGDFVAATAMGWQVKRADRHIFRRAACWKKIKRGAMQYRDFPLFSGTQSFMNALSQNIPVLLLAKFFGPGIAGFYAIAVRVLQAPMNFVLTSLRQVLFQKASELHHQGGDTYALFKRTTFGLLAIGAIPALLIMSFGPRIFAFILGDEWHVAGQYARWLILWLLVMFANVPALLFCQIYRKQKSLLFQNAALLFFRILAVVVGGLRHSPILAVVLYSLVGVFFNVAIIFWSGNFIKTQKGAPA